MPLPRDMLLPALNEGKVDLVAAQVTVTPERQKLVDFTNPTRTNVSEVVVTGPGAPAIASVDDLSGQDVFVRKDSSYYESLLALNGRLKAEGKPPVVIQEAPEQPRGRRSARDGQCRAGPDRRRRRLPRGVLEARSSPRLTVHDDGGAADRRQPGGRDPQEQPEARRTSSTTVLAKYGLGHGVRQRDRASGTWRAPKYVKNATSDAERKKFLALVELFRKYGDAVRRATTC